MSAINKLHDEAMDFSSVALMERARGNIDRAAEMFEQALKSELAAIAELDEPVEPTFSVLHRSAATLALDCGQLRLAEQLVAKALAQEPPFAIAEELRDDLEQANFQRHLELKGVVLNHDEFQLSLSGQAVGYGLVNLSEFTKRINNASKLIYRIAERKKGFPFRERGRIDNEIKRIYEPHISVPRAASFAITMKFSSPKQSSFPNTLGTEETIDEFMDLMELADNLKFADIERRIPDSAYRVNFVGLVKKIAPDGKEIHQVGFTTIRNGVERFVQVTKNSSQIPLLLSKEPSSSQAENVELRGRLRHADAIHKQGSNTIGIIDQEQTIHSIEVPEGMMNDIVRPMWDLEVVIAGLRTGNRIVLQDIWQLGSD